MNSERLQAYTRTFGNLYISVNSRFDEFSFCQLVDKQKKKMGKEIIILIKPHFFGMWLSSFDGGFHLANKTLSINFVFSVDFLRRYSLSPQIISIYINWKLEIWFENLQLEFISICSIYFAWISLQHNDDDK